MGVVNLKRGFYITSKWDSINKVGILDYKTPEMSWDHQSVGIFTWEEVFYHNLMRLDITTQDSSIYLIYLTLEPAITEDIARFRLRRLGWIAEEGN